MAHGATEKTRRALAGYSRIQLEEYALERARVADERFWEIQRLKDDNAALARRLAAYERAIAKARAKKEEQA